jgi:hypothetical protein
MSKQFRLMILANVFLMLLYCLFNWGEYSSLTTFGKVIIQSNFPFFIFITEYPSPMVTGFRSILFLNYPLLIFILSTMLNLYFINKLQRSKETK